MATTFQMQYHTSSGGDLGSYVMWKIFHSAHITMRTSTDKNDYHTQQPEVSTLVVSSSRDDCTNVTNFPNYWTAGGIDFGLQRSSASLSPDPNLMYVRKAVYQLMFRCASMLLSIQCRLLFPCGGLMANCPWRAVYPLSRNVAIALLDNRQTEQTVSPIICTVAPVV